jgi:hypothetical protein
MNDRIYRLNIINIKEQVVILGLKNKDICQLIKISNKELKDWFNDKIFPTAIQLVKLGEILRYNVSKTSNYMKRI